MMSCLYWLYNTWTSLWCRVCIGCITHEPLFTISDVKKNSRTGPVSAVDVYQVLCKLLHIQPLPHSGDWSKVKDIFEWIKYVKFQSRLFFCQLSYLTHLTQWNPLWHGNFYTWMYFFVIKGNWFSHFQQYFKWQSVLLLKEMEKTTFKSLTGFIT
jgi:hypothetical protein